MITAISVRDTYFYQFIIQKEMNVMDMDMGIKPKNMHKDLFISVMG